MGMWDRASQEFKGFTRTAIQAFYVKPETKDQHNWSKFWYEMVVLLGQLRRFETKLRDKNSGNWGDPDVVQAMHTMRDQLDLCIELAERLNP